MLLPLPANVETTASLYVPTLSDLCEDSALYASDAADVLVAPLTAPSSDTVLGSAELTATQSADVSYSSTHNVSHMTADSHISPRPSDTLGLLQAADLSLAGQTEQRSSAATQTPSSPEHSASFVTPLRDHPTPHEPIAAVSHNAIYMSLALRAATSYLRDNGDGDSRAHSESKTAKKSSAPTVAPFFSMASTGVANHRRAGPIRRQPKDPFSCLGSDFLYLPGARPSRIAAAAASGTLRRTVGTIRSANTSPERNADAASLLVPAVATPPIFVTKNTDDF
jgi:hypothetical protein